MNIAEQIEIALQYGDKITVVYNGGKNPGTARQITPLKTWPDYPDLVLVENQFGKQLNYNISKIEKVVDAPTHETTNEPLVGELPCSPLRVRLPDKPVIIEISQTVSKFDTGDKVITKTNGKVEIFRINGTTSNHPTSGVDDQYQMTRIPSESAADFRITRYIEEFDRVAYHYDSPEGALLRV